MFGLLNMPLGSAQDDLTEEDKEQIRLENQCIFSDDDIRPPPTYASIVEKFLATPRAA